VAAKQMYTLMVPDYIWDRVVAAVEKELPNAVVTRFPDSIQSDEDIDEYFIAPREM